MQIGITQEQLIAALNTLQPLELKAVKLRRAHKETGIAPGTGEVLAATKEMQEYMGRCKQFSKALSSLNPIASSLDVEAFPL